MKNDKYTVNFLIILVIALLVYYAPIAFHPLNWMCVFFYEISTGLATLVTFGSVKTLTLNFEGSGSLSTEGGVDLIVLNSGYIGSIILGVLIYQIGSNIRYSRTRVTSLIICGVIAAAAVILAKDNETWIILGLIFAFFFATLKFYRSFIMKIALKLSGISIILNAFRPIIDFFKDKHNSEAQSLAVKLNMMPEIAWIAIWTILAVYAMLYIWKRNR